MKKLFFAAILALINCSYVKAGITDVSTIDNVAYITPFSVSSGIQTTISIRMKNTAQIRSFQFDLYLPVGITAVKSSKGRIKGELSTSRLPDEDEHLLTLSVQPDGAIRFLCDSQYGDTFTDSDGEIATLQINVSAEMSVGDYPLYIRNMTLSETDIQKHYDTEVVESSITVGAPADTRSVLDETSTAIPTAATDVDVRVRRTIKANEWSTICLPFAMTEAQVKTAFGDDVQLGDFQGYEVKDAGETIGVKFADVTAIEKNHPYIIKVGADVAEFTVDDVDVDPEEEPMINFGTKSNPSAFVGNYVAGTAIEKGCLFLSDNKFWYSVGTTTIKGFRGYFNFDDLLPDFEDNYAAARVMMMFDDDVVTGIDASLSSKGEHRYYNLGGQRISHPKKKGLYIQEGKKLIVK